MSESPRLVVPINQPTADAHPPTRRRTHAPTKQRPRVRGAKGAEQAVGPGQEVGLDARGQAAPEAVREVGVEEGEEGLLLLTGVMVVGVGVVMKGGG